MNKTGTLLTSNFITCNFIGRTGNMMFEVAHAYAKALKYNRQFVAPYVNEALYFKDTLFRKIEFSAFNTLDEIAIKQLISPFEYVAAEPYSDVPTKYVGYYQSEKYFEGYTEAIKNLYAPPLDFVKKATTAYPFLLNSTVAAISVRRGDYLSQSARHPVVSLNYIEEAYKQLPPHDVLLVMSDDIEWCMENIKLPNVIFNDNSKFWNHEGIWLLSLCDHFIISNSTFSWWGAWLSRNTSKVVVAPGTWFGPEITEKIEDLICENWIKLPCKYSNGSILAD